MAPRPLWTVPREWPGETVFVVAGGASVLGLDLLPLAGRRVVAVKSSWRRVPAADVLYFADLKWWTAHGAATRAFAGIICTSSDAGDERVRFLARHEPKGKGGPLTLADRPDAVAVRHTSLTAAINIAVHYGAARIVLLGADNGPAPDGRFYHHDHPCMPPKDERWALQRADLATVAAHLTRLGVETVNASPASRLGCWPRRTLEECL